MKPWLIRAPWRCHILPYIHTKHPDNRGYGISWLLCQIAGPPPADIQSVIPVPANERWRGMEEDGAVWRAERRTARHISPNAHQSFSRARQRGLSPHDGGLLETTRTRLGFWTYSRREMEALLLMTFGAVWPSCQASPKPTVRSSSPPFSGRARDGASPQRAEPPSKTSPPRTHQLRHRPDSGSRDRGGERARAREAKWIRFKRRGRLLQLGEPDGGQRALVHRAVHLPLRYHASGGGCRFVRREQESGKPGRDTGPGSQTRGSPGTPEPGPERCSWVWRTVLPLDRKQVRQRQNIR